MGLILIVEDNAAYRRILKEMLCRRFPSSSVEEAENGREALQKVNVLSPDLILMDIKLPEVNGLELTKKIRANYDGMVVVVLTSYDLPEYREAAYRSGADYFFAKGTASGEEIMNVVESVIARKAQSGHGGTGCGMVGLSAAMG